MQKTYTEDDLILFIYNELSAEESLAIRQALTDDLQLHRTYAVLLQTVRSLDMLSMEPDPTSVEIILEHSHHEEQFFH